MDDTDLYQEENLSVTKDIRDSLKGASIITLAPKMPDEIKAAITNEVKAKLIGDVNVSADSLEPLSKEITSELEIVANQIVKAIQEAKPDLVHEVTVKNISEAQNKSVHIDNLSSLESLIDNLVQKVIDNPPVVNVQKQEVKLPNTAKDYVSVRLTDGKQFYEALLHAASGGGPSVVGLKANGSEVSDANPLPVSATVEVGDVQIGAVEIKNATDDTRATVGANGLYVEVRSTALPSTPVAFVTTVTTAGTRVQLASNTLTNGGIIQAPSTNTGLIYVGGSNVSSTVYGAELQPGQSTSIAIDNTNKIYVDSSVNGDKVACLGG